MPRRSLWLDEEEDVFVSGKARGWLRKLVRREMSPHHCENKECGHSFPGVLNACPYCRLPIPAEERWDR